MGLIALGFAAPAVPLVAALCGWALPVPLPEKAPPVPRAARAAIGLEPNGGLQQVVRLHLGGLEDSGRLPRSTHLHWHLRGLALSLWLSCFWTRDEIADAYAARVWMGDERWGLDEWDPLESTCRHASLSIL